MKQIKDISKTVRLALLSSGLALCLAQTNVLAAPVGTPSNTDINNIAKLSYSVGTVAQNEICSSPTGNITATTTTTGSVCSNGTAGAANTTFKVDNKVNILVIEKNASPTTVVPGQLKAVTTFTVTNNGNTTQDYLLTGNYALSGTTVFATADNFDPVASSCSVFVDSNANGTYEAATDTASFIGNLASGDSKDVFIVCDIPTTRINNDFSVVELTAETRTAGGSPGAALTATTGVNTAGVDIVFADPATPASTNGTIPLQTASDAKGFARDAYKVVSAVLNVKKVVTTVCDPINGNSNPKDIPGAAVQYAITVSNTGSATATLTNLSDVVNNNLLFNNKLNSGSAPVAFVDASCAEGAPSSLSASGFGAVKGTTAAPGYTAPGVAGQAVTAGATQSGVTITIDYATLTAPGISAPVTLATGESITVYFNAFIK